ncbi:MAG: TonB-dependent receptor plug domain-containing protein, partial [Bradyrhizobium sp.]
MKGNTMKFANARKLRVSQLPLVIGLALNSTGAYAQTAAEQEPTPPDDNGQAVTLEGVTVTGMRAAIKKSLVDKRNAPGIVDAIAAEDMGKFPDLNLSESLQRIPGVTLDRNSNGEGRAINLRGLGPEFTRVEINGMSGVSNGTGGRFGLSEGGRGFNFEIFASELFSKATVYKTGMAEIDEGGLAGTVRLETPRPLDREGLNMTASVLANYSDIGNSVDPRSAFLLSYNKDDVFGIAASVAYSSTDFVSNTIEAGSWRPFAAANTGTRASDEVRAAWNANGPRYYVFNEGRDTLGTTVTVQFRPVDNMTFTIDGLYGKLDSDRMSLRDDMAIEGGANAPIDATIEDGVITSGSFTNIQQRVGANFYKTDETYQQITGSLEWTPN